MFVIDASDFERLARDLEGAARADFLDDLDPVVKRAAQNVKSAMQDDLRTSEHFDQVAPAVTYDVERGRDFTEALVGVEPDKATGRARKGKPGTPGNLAHIAYFGGVRGGGGTVPDPDYLLAAEYPNLEEQVGAALDRLLGEL